MVEHLKLALIGILYGAAGGFAVAIGLVTFFGGLWLAAHALDILSGIF